MYLENAVFELMQDSTCKELYAPELVELLKGSAEAGDDDGKTPKKRKSNSKGNEKKAKGARNSKGGAKKTKKVSKDADEEEEDVEGDEEDEAEEGDADEDEDEEGGAEQTPLAKKLKIAIANQRKSGAGS